MIESIVVPVTGLTTQAIYQIKGRSFRLVAVHTLWVDPGGATTKVYNCFVSDPSGATLFKASTPTIPAGQAIIHGLFGIGMSHGIGTDGTSLETYAAASLPNIWIDQDCQINVVARTPEAATFLNEFRLWVEVHDRT